MKLFWLFDNFSISSGGDGDGDNDADSSSSSCEAYYNQTLRFIGNYINNNNNSSTYLQLFWQQTLDQLQPQLLYSRVLSSFAEALEHIVIACLGYLLVCLGIYKLTFLVNAAVAAAKPNGQQQQGNGNRLLSLLQVIRSVRLPPASKLQRVLLVIAHPDDECMFFGPLIVSLTQRENCQVYLLCLTNGNYNNQADLRREELWHSCNTLGIQSENIILMNATNLPDDPNVEWETKEVAKVILHTVESLGIQALITFDRDGVSQHMNHCSVYYAAASLCLANLLPNDCTLYTLDTINVVRKYLSIFDLLCTCLMSSYWCILSFKQACTTRNAMKQHASQMLWFRWIYIYFSRYMFINSMREVNLSDVELEMQIHEN